MSKKIYKQQSTSNLLFSLMKQSMNASQQREISVGIRSNIEIHTLDATQTLNHDPRIDIVINVKGSISPLSPFFKHQLQSEISKRGGLDYENEVGQDLAQEISSFAL
ncbi:hypothetical protein L3V83_01325 [Thiotrichales bacterium 19X7-9]|nr:hypothetical protein [Thiotrichales bacterium 19X7-9]